MGYHGPLATVDAQSPFLKVKLSICGFFWMDGPRPDCLVLRGINKCENSACAACFYVRFRAGGSLTRKFRSAAFVFLKRFVLRGIADNKNGSSDFFLFSLYGASLTLKVRAAALYFKSNVWLELIRLRNSKLGGCFT